MKGDLSLLELICWPFPAFPVLLCTLCGSAIWNTTGIQHAAGTIFLFFFVNSKHRCFVSALNWISLICTCQPERSRGGQCGGLISTKICTDCASVWQSPLEKDVKCLAEHQRLCGHFIAINTAQTRCNVMCLLLCGCLPTDPAFYTVLCTLCSSQCVYITGSNNYIHLCHMVEAICYPFTVLMTKSFVICTAATKQSYLQLCVDAEMWACFALSY